MLNYNICLALCVMEIFSLKLKYDRGNQFFRYAKKKERYTRWVQDREAYVEQLGIIPLTRCTLGWETFFLLKVTNSQKRKYKQLQATHK